MKKFIVSKKRKEKKLRRWNATDVIIVSSNNKPKYFGVEGAESLGVFIRGKKIPGDMTQKVNSGDLGGG